MMWVIGMVIGMVLYAFMAGVMWAWSKARGYNEEAKSICAIFWPICLPIMSGIWIVEKLTPKERP